MSARLLTILLSLLCVVNAAACKLTPYLAEGSGNTAVIVCPGGSYFWLDRKTEGTEVAKWLQSNGISAFVLEYRVGGIESFITHSRLIRRGNRYPDMLEDLQRAIAEVRIDSVKYRINPSRVGVMGFSAGGHLAALSGIGIKVVEEPHGISLKPDFIASVYPVVSFTDRCTHKRSRRGIMGERINATLCDSLSLERHIPADMPPVFLVNCMDDPVVDPRNSILLDSALTAEGITHRYLQFPTGGHGFGSTAAKTSTEAATWTTSFLQWLESLFTPQP